ncbi:MAG: hypothetical protein BJ554DRAFT_6558, partial [Olpidium bornovanus]
KRKREREKKKRNEKKREKKKKKKPPPPIQPLRLLIAPRTTRRPTRPRPTTGTTTGAPEEEEEEEEEQKKMDGFGRESPPSGKADAESALLHPLTDVLSVSDDVGASCFDSDFGDPHQQHGHDPRAAERGGGGGGVVPNPADGAVEFRRQRAFGRAAPCSGGRSPDRAHGSDVGSVKSLRHHPAEGDVCYSPYTRRTLDSAVDHDALSEYLATGDVDAAHRKSPAAAVTQRRVTRRDSKGFTFGKDGRRLRKSVSDIIKAGGFWLDVTSPTADEMKAFSKSHPRETVLIVKVQLQIFGIHPLTVEDIQMQEDRENNYLAQISIEITQSSNQTNAVLNKITIIGSILVPMNVVTGKLCEVWTLPRPGPWEVSQPPWTKNIDASLRR